MKENSIAHSQIFVFCRMFLYMLNLNIVGIVNRFVVVTNCNRYDRERNRERGCVQQEQRKSVAAKQRVRKIWKDFSLEFIFPRNRLLGLGVRRFLPFFSEYVEQKPESPFGFSFASFLFTCNCNAQKIVPSLIKIAIENTSRSITALLHIPIMVLGIMFIIALLNLHRLYLIKKASNQISNKLISNESEIPNL